MATTNYTINQFKDDIKKMNYKNACNISAYSYGSHVYGMVEGGEYQGVKLNALENRLFNSFKLYSETMMNGTKKECDEIADVMKSYKVKLYRLVG